MSLKAMIIIGLLCAALSGGAVWYIYEKGVAAGKADCKAGQEKYERKVRKGDAEIDKKTPFNADRPAQLEWLRDRTVRN